MGIKQQKVNQFEDTSSAFVRMRLNKVFEIRYLENFKMRQLYLSALHNASQNQNKDSKEKGKEMMPIRKRMKSGVSDSISRKLKMSARNSKRRRKDTGDNTVDNLNDKIDLDSIIDYEKEERESTNKDLKKTAKNIDTIFLSSFSEINEKNMKSFLWQNFSIYTRKPGLDLSPFIILSLALFTIYGAVFINQLGG